MRGAKGEGGHSAQRRDGHPPHNKSMASLRAVVCRSYFKFHVNSKIDSVLFFLLKSI